eukprot:5555872-Prymnesium_polylepis.1
MANRHACGPNGRDTPEPPAPRDRLRTDENVHECIRVLYMVHCAASRPEPPNAYTPAAARDVDLRKRTPAPQRQPFD